MKMTDDELLAKIKNEERNSLDYFAGSLADERAENMELYLGDKTRELAAVEGRSSVVSMDVQEAVESMMPYLMKVFCSGDEVVKFNPVSAEDVPQAEQETDYVNHVIVNQNNFFLVATQWFKDALINKNGYVKYWWDESETVTEERYEGLTDAEFQMLLADPSVEPIEHEYEPLENTPEAQALIEAAEEGDEQASALVAQMPMLHEVKVKVHNTKGRVRIEPCPPEEVLVSADERSLDPNSVRFLEHRQWKTISELREMGYDVEDDIADDSSTLFLSTEWLSRNEYAEEDIGRDVGTGAMRRVVYREVYLMVDYDGDGIAERRMICLVGDKILENETADIVPFANITPYIMPHKHIGRALADYVKDIQVIKSVIMRNVLDNFYASNNGRWAISNKVNLDDLLVSRPGGIVRVEGSPGSEIMPLVQSPIGNAAFPLMEYLDTNKENRTGITRYNQGLDANSLNKTASGISQIMSAAQAKQELIARTFAETGVKQLFSGIHKLILQHAKEQEMVRLRNQWVPVDPRQWKTRTDMTVSVGLGTGNKQEMLVQIMQILQVQEKALALGIATPQNIYESCIELTKNAGFKDGDKYWTNPAQTPPQPKPDPEQSKIQGMVMLEQMKQKAQGEQSEKEIILQAQKDLQKAQLDAEVKRMQAELEAAKEANRLEFEKWKTELVESNKIVLQQMQLKQQAMSVNALKEGETLTEYDENGTEQPTSALTGLVEAMNNNVMALMQMQDAKHQQLVEVLTKPKQIIRDANGRVAGVQ